MSTAWVPTFADVREVVVRTYESWRDHRTIRLGAGLSYYGLFSLSSVVAVSVALLRIIGRSDAVEEAIRERIELFVGPDGAASVAALFEELEGPSGTSIGLIGLGSLLVTGSLFFLALEDAMNQIWDVPVRSGLTSSVRRRLVSLVVLLGAALTLVSAFAVQTASSLLERFVPGSAEGLQAVAALVSNALGWGVLVVALALLFRYLPAVELSWRPVLIAAGVTSGLLVVGTALIGWYLRTIGASSVGGAASTPIAILVWIYYEAQILLAGVHLSRILAER